MPRLDRLLVAALLILSPATAPLALDPPEVGAPGALIGADADFLAPALPLSDALSKALISRDHATAVTELNRLGPPTVPGRALGDLAFLKAWSLVRAGRATEAVSLLEPISKAELAPAPYRDLVLGEVLLADGRAVEAATVLEGVDPASRVWARARLAAAEARFQAGATAESRALYQELASRPDPSEGTDQALAVLAARAGQGSEEAYPLLRRIWARYPTSRAAKEAETALAAYEAKGSRYRASRAEIAARGEALMDAGRLDEAISFLGAKLANFTKGDAPSCQAWYAYGRSLFKKNRLSEAIAVLGPAGEQCEGVDEDRGARSLYIAGKAQERRKEWALAAALYEQIPARYPSHTMADDGYALAGIGWQEAGDPAKAIKLWEAQVNAYTDGDLAAEGFWRLAWNAYLAGKPEQAIAYAERMVWEVPLESDAVHGLGARYWSARWRIYPDVASPTALNPSSDQVEQGVRLLLELCRDHPTSFFALLAANRLRELAPDRLAALSRPAFPRNDPPLLLRKAFVDEPAVAWGVALARLGLVREAMAELDTLPDASLSPSEMALVTRIQAPLDPVTAHNRLHHFLLDHPLSSLDGDAPTVLRQAFPDLYWQELQSAAADYDWDARIFHGLVREESSFNPKIVSFAGARGLSQLMPATAAEVAKKMGLSVTKDRLFEPELNLKLGTRFYDGLVSQYNKSFYLATASYNAGPGNVNGWLSRFGNVPVDEFIERIPIRETRGYVKRVLGTYQVYHVLYDPGPLFADWSATNHKAKPSG